MLIIDLTYTQLFVCNYYIGFFSYVTFAYLEANNNNPLNFGNFRLLYGPLLGAMNSLILTTNIHIYLHSIDEAKWYACLACFALKLRFWFFVERLALSHFIFVFKI